jgi:hypothetical protein
MTSIEKLIVKFIDDKFSYPYLYYDKVEQTWTNEFFLFDIKTGVMYVSNEVKETLNKKFGKGYMDRVFVTVVNHWFMKSYNLKVIHVS